MVQPTVVQDQILESLSSCRRNTIRSPNPSKQYLATLVPRRWPTGGQKAVGHCRSAASSESRGSDAPVLQGNAMEVTLPILPSVKAIMLKKPMQTNNGTDATKSRNDYKGPCIIFLPQVRRFRSTPSWASGSGSRTSCSTYPKCGLGIVII